MAERFYRAQILLERGQHRLLKRIAEREERSISEVARQAIQLGLEAMEQDKQTRLERFHLAMEKLEAARQRVLAEHGPVEEDLIGEVRRTRDRQVDEPERG
jgi:hypothetical protein